MTQQSIIGRITQLARTNINALLDQAEDPRMMVDQMIRDFTSGVSDAEGAIALTIGNLRMMEDDAREEQAAAGQWGAKAAAASAKADEMRAASDTAEADRFDNLARVALRRQIDGEADARTLAIAIADQSDVCDKLKAGLTEMRTKLDSLRRTRDELVGHAQTMEARSTMRDSIRSVDILDPSSEIARFEEKIRREEARMRGHEDLAASTLDAQFEQLSMESVDADVEARLAELKGGHA